MSMVIAENELFNACNILFGRDMQISRSFLEYLQPSGIKTAYRKKAMETHPDMLAHKSEPFKKKSADIFQIVQQAYESLLFYLDAREKGFKFNSAPLKRYQTTGTRPPYKPTPRKSTKTSAKRTTQKASAKASAKRQTKEQAESSTARNRPHSGAFRSIPPRKLLFGHYLYYSGLTNWQTIVKALVWQRNKRPKLGEIGQRFGWLDNKDVLAILKNRNFSRSFGESAVSMGKITNNQLRLMVFQQQRLQKKFGDYYVQNNIISKNQLNNLILNFQQHNRNISNRRQARFHS